MLYFLIFIFKKRSIYLHAYFFMLKFAEVIIYCIECVCA